MAVSSTMGTKFKFFVLFTLASATVSIQSNMETADLLHNFSLNGSDTEDFSSNDGSAVSTYVNGNDGSVVDYLSEEKGSLDADKNTKKDANFKPIIDIFVDAGMKKAAVDENLNKSRTNGNLPEGRLMDESLNRSETNKNSNATPITKGMLLDFFTKLEEDVRGKVSDGRDLVDKLNPELALGSETHTAKSSDSLESHPKAKDTEEVPRTRLEVPQNIDDVSKSSEGENMYPKEIAIERLPIFAPLPYLANIPFLIPIPLPVDNMTSGAEMLPPATYVSDRLPVPDVIDEKSALIVAEDNDTENHGSETAKEVISQILGSLFGVKLPPPPPIPYLPILSENKGKVRFQNESKVVDMLGRKYLMRSKMSQLPFDDKSGVIMKFMSLTPLETQNERGEKDGSKVVKTITPEEITKDIDKESSINDQQETNSDEKANGPESGREIFRTLQDPYKKSLLDAKPDILIVGQSQGFDTEGSAESTRREIDEANQKNLEGLYMKPDNSEESSKKEAGNVEPEKLDILKREGSYSVETGKEDILKHKSSTDANGKGHDYTAVGEDDSLKVDKSNDPLLTSSLANPKDSIVIKNADELTSIAKDKFSVASKEEGIFDQNSEDKENPIKKPSEFVVKPSTVSLDDIRIAVETPHFELDKKIKSEDKDLKSEVKDLKSEDKALEFEVKKLKSEDTGLTLDEKDLNSQGLFMTSENEDLVFKDKDLKSEDKKLTFKSNAATSEKKELSAENKDLTSKYSF